MTLKKSQFTGGLTRAALLGVVLIGVTAGAMTIARRGPSVLATTTAAAAPAQMLPSSAKMVSPTQISAAPVARVAPVTKPPVTRQAAATTAAVKPSLVKLAAMSPAPAVVKAPVDAVEPDDAVVTLTGCLQHDDGTYRLKDTNGAEAPKSRSWKSGFLKKRAATVEVVDSANRLRLPTHIGQRVTVTGVLLDREMRARAVQRLGVCS